MKNTFGNHVAITLFGESHGPSIGCIIDGLAPGLAVDIDRIDHLLRRRRPNGAISTARQEADCFIIESGVFNGKTTGTPICIRIPNEDVLSCDYDKDLVRPGHADYTAECKYHGHQDYRGGGHFSGRITAALVAAAGIVIPALEKKGITIGTHISCLGGVEDRSFGNVIDDIALLSRSDFPVLDEGQSLTMQQRILQAKEAGDSVGGVLETAVVGLPAGLGEPWFDSVEGLLSHALFSIPAVKGVAFGSGFDLADMTGSQANDPFVMDGNRVVTTTNHNGGVNGGITNGMPLLFKTVIKPTPTIGKEQDTVILSSCEAAKIKGIGRHDPCIVHRAAVVTECVTALVLCDMLTGRYGTDWLGEV